MNYYEHHLGDYAKDTGHLSMLEHGAYRILLDRYYSTEAGIPEGQVYRLARARSEEEKAAVDVVLEEFFYLVDGIWINRRAEEELERLAVVQAETEAKTENERDRVKRHREQRANLFADLRRFNVIPDWNIKTKELRALHAKHCNGNGNEPVTAPVTAHETLQVNFGNVADTAFTPDSMTPDVQCVVTPKSPPPGSRDDGTNPRSTGENPRATGNNPRALGTNPRAIWDQPGHEPPSPEESATRRGQLAALLRAQGVDITPANPDLCRWVDSGLTDAEAQEAIDRARLSKPPPEKIPAKYLAAIVPKVIADRDAPKGPLPRASPPRKAGGYKTVEQQNREAAARAKAMLFGDKDNVIEGEVIHG